MAKADAYPPRHTGTTPPSRHIGTTRPNQRLWREAISYVINGNLHGAMNLHVDHRAERGQLPNESDDDFIERYYNACVIEQAQRAAKSAERKAQAEQAEADRKAQAEQAAAQRAAKSAERKAQAEQQRAAQDAALR